MKHCFFLLTLAALLSGCTTTGDSGTDGNGADALLQDNTARRTPQTDTPTRDLLRVTLDRPTHRVDYKAITVYFSKNLRLPLCVAYELTNTAVAMSDAPDAEKRDGYKFNRDSAVDGCPDWWEYKQTDFDRGHMAPAMDMRWDRDAMRQCFLMTNICPQDHDLNGGEWRHAEEAVHHWAKRASRLLVFTGPVVAKQPRLTGPKHDIAVPEAFYKVVYAPEQRRAVAFLFDNAPCHTSWTRHVVSVDSVERRAGINLLAALPDSIETAVECRSRLRDWPTYTPRR